MQVGLFYIFASVALLSAIGVIALPRPTRALLALSVTMAALAVLFLLLGAYFVAMVHLIVYAGAVLVLFLFVIMLQGVGATDVPLAKRFSPVFIAAAGLVSLLLMTFVVLLIRRTPLASPREVLGTVENIGAVLFSEFLLPFELTSLLILVAVFAAVALAKKEAP